MSEHDQNQKDPGTDGAAGEGSRTTSTGHAAVGDGEGETPHPPPELAAATPEERFEALQAERDDIKDRMLRIAAEFENFKKRARKAEIDAVAEARERVLKDMLEVVDNLERATGAQAQATGNGAVDAAAVLKGVNLVLRVLHQKLERYEVRPFESQGQPFDPRLHEAISRVESDVPSGAVAVELQKGYRVGERLLRPALVSVSTGGAGKKPPEG